MLAFRAGSEGSNSCRLWFLANLGRCLFGYGCAERPDLEFASHLGLANAQGHQRFRERLKQIRNDVAALHLAAYEKRGFDLHGDAATHDNVLGLDNRDVANRQEMGSSYTRAKETGGNIPSGAYSSSPSGIGAPQHDSSAESTSDSTMSLQGSGEDGASTSGTTRQDSSIVSSRGSDINSQGSVDHASDKHEGALDSDEDASASSALGSDLDHDDDVRTFSLKKAQDESDKGSADIQMLKKNARFSDREARQMVVVYRALHAAEEAEPMVADPDVNKGLASLLLTLERTIKLEREERENSEADRHRLQLMLMDEVNRLEVLNSLQKTIMRAEDASDLPRAYREEHAEEMGRIQDKVGILSRLNSQYW